MEPLPKVPVWEMLTRLNQRTVLGRVVVNPPGRMAPIYPHATGEQWFFCKECGFACLTREKMTAHKQKHVQNEPSSGSEEDEEEDDSEKYVIGNGNDSDDEVALEFKGDIINKKKDHFQCGICRKVLVSLRGLRNHHIVHQDVRPQRCKICEVTFKTKGHRDRHMQRSHNPSFTNRCKFCPCRFETAQGLTRHTVFYHDHQTSTNTNDSKIVTSGPEPEEVSETTEPKTQKKPVIIKTSHALQKYDDEIAIESKAKKKPAIIKTSPELQKYNDEITIEPKAKKKPAIIKAASVLRKYNSAIKIKLPFSSKYSVQARTDRSVVLKAIHQNSKLNFECHVCGKKCSTGHGLRGHLRTHTGEKPYSCTKCDANFAYNAALRKHLLTTHGNGAFRCLYCPCRLSTEGTRRHHYTLYHPNEAHPVRKRIVSRSKTKLVHG